MVSSNRILPGHKMPDLQLGSNAEHGFNLRTTVKEIDNFLLLVFYRGHHSSFCKSYLQKFDKLIKKFNKKGMKVVAISMDKEEDALKTIEDWKINNLEIAHGLSVEIAKVWGLFLSSEKKFAITHKFNEPAIFVVNKDGELYSAQIQSMPFSRPNPKKLLKKLKWCLKHEYPIRGGA